MRILHIGPGVAIGVQNGVLIKLDVLHTPVFEVIKHHRPYPHLSCDALLIGQGRITVGNLLPRLGNRMFQHILEQRDIALPRGAFLPFPSRWIRQQH